MHTIHGTTTSAPDPNQTSKKRLGRWTLESLVPDSKPPRWNCVCDCGTKREIGQASLNSGRSRSCGCFAKDIHRNISYKKGAN